MKKKEQQRMKQESPKELSQKETNQSNKSKVFNFFNSPFPIIIVLGILCVFLLAYIKSISNSVTLYTYGGYSGEFTFMNGTIFIGRDVNYFGDSKIKYDGDDIELREFEIGYYIKRDEGDFKLATIEDIDDMEGKDASLKSILENSNFSFTESHKEANFLSEHNIKNLENLIFKIKGKDKKGNEVNIEVPLEINKVTN